MLLDIADLNDPSSFEAGGVVTVRIPMDNVGRGSSMAKIADDWCALSLIVESLATVSRIISYQLDRSGSSVADLLCVPTDWDRFFGLVAEFADGYEMRGIDETDEDYDDGYAARSEFQEALDSHIDKLLSLAPVHRPDIGDICLANWTEAAIEAHDAYGDDEDYDERNPEVRCGFWKSCRSPHLGRPLYMSARSVFYQGVDLDAADCLKVLFPDDGRCVFSDARLAPALGIVTTNGVSMEIDLTNVESALECAARLWGGARPPLGACRCALSADHSVITLTDGKVTYIFGEFME